MRKSAIQDYHRTLAWMLSISAMAGGLLGAALAIA